MALHVLKLPILQVLRERAEAQADLEQAQIDRLDYERSMWGERWQPATTDVQLDVDTAQRDPALQSEEGRIIVAAAIMGRMGWEGGALGRPGGTWRCSRDVDTYNFPLRGHIYSEGRPSDRPGLGYTGTPRVRHCFCYIFCMYNFYM